MRLWFWREFPDVHRHARRLFRPASGVMTTSATPGRRHRRRSPTVTRRKIDPFSAPSKRMKRKGKRKDVKHKLHKERTAGQRPLCLVWSCCSELLLVSVAVFGESDHCALFPTCLPSSLRKERRRRGTGLAPEFWRPDSRWTIARYVLETDFASYCIILARNIELLQ